MLGLILPGGAPQAYRISRSLRLRAAATAYLSRTPGGAGNRKTWTFSAWVKRGLTTAGQVLFMGGATQSDTGATNISFGDVLTVQGFSTNWLVTSALYRDYAAWYHFVVGMDSTNATANNRLRISCNGSEVTAFSTRNNLTQNTDYGINQAALHRIGYQSATFGVNYFDGLMAEINFIDGQQLDASYFGQTDPATGQWVPKKYTGTYGTNGFYLDFSDNSAADATHIGADRSGNGNNFTPTNISVAAGATNDSLVDVPTRYGVDTGAGGEVRGNYATWSAVDKYLSFPAPTDGALSQNVNGVGTWAFARTTFAIPEGTGLWQWELVQTGSANGSDEFGICLTSVQTSITGTPSGRAGCSGVDSASGAFINGVISGSIVYPTVGHTITCLYDATNHTFQVFDNGTSKGTITGLPAGDVTPFIAASSTNGSPTFVANFGQRAFGYNKGGKALCTQNLPDPAIKKPNQFFDAITFTGNGNGNGDTQAIVNAGGFQPDLVWSKARNSADSNVLADSVRGAGNELLSNTTGDEFAGNQISAFNSNGFTVRRNTTYNQQNVNNVTYVGWNWKKGALPGVDIVSYTGNGANRTINHSLGVAPKLIIIKARTTAGADQGWPVYHAGNTAAPETDYLLLNGTAITTDDNTLWNDTAPTSGVFSVGTHALVNTNNDSYIAYLFSEIPGFSKFGSYIGNGNVDGPFVWCGFRPRLLMIKRTDVVNNWGMFDSARAPYNMVANELYADLANVEGSTGGLDILSNAFKCRLVTSAAYINAANGTYIFAAFAESPFKYARAR